MPLGVHFMHLGKKKITAFLSHVAKYLLFSTKFHLIHGFCFFCSNNTDFFSQTYTEIKIPP
jgi:hypothetical protein